MDSVVLEGSTAAADSNWIPDVNKFGLPKPPAWFLKMMWDQDAGLVILPSRQAAKYIVARRRDRSLKVMAIIEQTLKKHKRIKYLDSDMLEGRKLVGVDAIVGNVMGGSWNPAMLMSLRGRDTWIHGGADGYIKKLEADEEQVRIDKRVKLLDDIDQRAKDSYRSYQARTGQRTILAGKRESEKSPLHSGSIAGSGSGIVITG